MSTELTPENAGNFKIPGVFYAQNLAPIRLSQSERAECSILWGGIGRFYWENRVIYPRF